MIPGGKLKGYCKQESLGKRLLYKVKYKPSEEMMELRAEEWGGNTHAMRQRKSVQSRFLRS